MTKDNLNKQKDINVNQSEIIDTSKHQKLSLRSVWIVLFLVVLMVTGSAVWFYQKLHKNEQYNQQQMKAWQLKHQALNDSLQQESQKLAILQQSLADAQQQQQNFNDQLKKALSHSQMNSVEIRKQWTLSEVKYLLDVANQKAVLSHDVVGALKALQMADSQLEQLNDYQLHPLRELIAQEKQALQAVGSSDIEGMALTLQAAAKRVNSLQIKQAQPMGDALAVSSSKDTVKAEAGWKQALNDVWQKVRSLVVIRYDQSGKAPTLKPKERYFLYQNLQLQLESARLVLLKANQESFKQSLQTAIDWLNSYFVGDEKAAMVVILTQLQQNNIQLTIPDISASLNWLKEHQQ